MHTLTHTHTHTYTLTHSETAIEHIQTHTNKHTMESYTHINSSCNEHNSNSLAVLKCCLEYSNMFYGISTATTLFDVLSFLESYYSRALKLFSIHQLEYIHNLTNPYSYKLNHRIMLYITHIKKLVYLFPKTYFPSFK